MLKTLEDLVNIIRERKSSSDETSYTSKLLKDKSLSLEKVKEEIGELIEAVASATGSTKAEAGRAIDATVDAVTGALKKGDTVTLIGFGTFKVSSRAARTGRNPQTGASMHIAASKVPGFKAGKGLKDKVKNS